ncbi:glycosyltransferase family 4 protein [Pseudoxanthomonas sp. SGNA-20]|uniref:glycosyltransferase n=1 Tax=Pseudoxanthomonas sp. SGNA-20 TaxID=2493088 RepID=UPI000F632F61|nr:glycosyltransferase [Pseudoxanthomonas sp. SGNA-20]RRN58791.1 glycosyltransferase family 4 protein [Pseudoxanthomonas sp. SGNA-20]
MNPSPRPRLLVLASTYPRWANDHEPGFVHELAKRLVDHFEVMVLCPHAPGAATRETLDGVEVVRYRYAPESLERLVNDGGIVTNLRRHPWMLALLPGFLLGQLLALASVVRHRPPAAIHAHWIIPQGFVAALAGTLGLHRSPILVTSHGADLYALGGWLPRKLKQWTLRRCTRATVVSTAMLEPLHSLGMAPAHTSVAPMGVDCRRFAPHPGTPRSPRELLFVGRLVEKKGLRHLLDAMPMVVAKHPGTTLTIAGFGPELEERMAQARHLGIADKVRFLGAVTHDRLPDLYRRVAMLVAPFVPSESGDRDGLGLVSAEALACECPVVTTRIDAVKEVFDGIWPPHCVTPGSPDELAEAICKVLDRHDDAVSWAQEQAIRIRKKHDWSSVSDDYASMLKDLAPPH